MSAWAEDLSHAMQTGKCVRVTLFNGMEFKLNGVHEVNEAEGWVLLDTPRTMDDSTTRTRVRLDEISTVMVTDVQCNDPR